MLLSLVFFLHAIYLLVFSVVVAFVCCRFLWGFFVYLFFDVVFVVFCFYCCCFLFLLFSDVLSTLFKPKRELSTKRVKLRVENARLLFQIL